MTNYKKVLGLLSIVVTTPLVFATSAIAGPTPWPTPQPLPRPLPIPQPIPRPFPIPQPIPTPIPYCNPLYCTRPDFEIQRPELEKPVLEDSIQLEEIRNIERVRQLKYDEFRSEPILEPAGESAPPKKSGIEQYLKFDE